MTWAIGDTVGNLRLEGLLGEGAVGVVYRAHHLALGIDVAVKILKREGHRHDPRWVERFRREAQVLARLDHPGVVRVLDVGDRDGEHWLVMELVDGFSLDQWLRRRQEPIDDKTVLRVIAAVASALSAAHDAGIIHRDLKPANLLLSRKGHLKVADLGLARDDAAAALTREKVAVGSPSYMSPEALTPGTPLDHRSDLYALGVIGYQLVFGRLPYTGTMSQVVHGHLAGRARFDLATTCKASTVALVRKLMAHDPADRPASALAALAEARRLLGGTGPVRREGQAARTEQQGSSELLGLVRVIERGLAANTSERGGERIVHTTARERLLVWLLLGGVLTAAIAGFVMTR